MLFKNDPDITEEYSQILDVDKLAKKLADECYKILRKHPLSPFTGRLDELLEEEIHKYTARVIELQKQNPNLNIFQQWFSR
jgi:hypothetical protein